MSGADTSFLDARFLAVDVLPPQVPGTVRARFVPPMQFEGANGLAPDRTVDGPGVPDVAKWPSYGITDSHQFVPAIGVSVYRPQLPAKFDALRCRCQAGGFSGADGSTIGDPYHLTGDLGLIAWRFP